MDIPMVLVSALVIPSILLEYGATDERARALGSALNWLIWGAFVTEYLIGLKVAPQRRTFVRNHLLDAAIVVFTIPFLPAIFGSARLVRLLRLSRLLRLKPLVVYLIENRGERYIAGFAVTVVLVSGFAFSQMESLPLGDGIYWAVTTVTTVGYGDFSPTGTDSRVLASVVMIIGVATFAALSAVLAGRIIGVSHVAEKEEARRRSESLEAEINRLAAQVERLSADINKHFK